VNEIWNHLRDKPRRHKILRTQLLSQNDAGQAVKKFDGPTSLDIGRRILTSCVGHDAGEKKTTTPVL